MYWSPAVYVLQSDKGVYSSAFMFQRWRHGSLNALASISAAMSSSAIGR
jgi:hypothetical protein